MSDFWEELCGTSSFRTLGLVDINLKSLMVYDEWYLNDIYPYLLNEYIDLGSLYNKDILEIGLGFGSLGEKLFIHSKSYIGLDYANNPVDLMNYRINKEGCMDKARSLKGDARNLPFEDGSFDYVVSIGCLHHTGNVQKCADEVYRVLRKNGECLVMLYNKNSFRRIIYNRIKYLKKKLFKQLKYRSYKEYERATYDRNSKGEAAPITDYFSVKDVQKIFSKYIDVDIYKNNFDSSKYFPRNIALKTIAPFLGLDLYIKAKKGNK